MPSAKGTAYASNGCILFFTPDAMSTVCVRENTPHQCVVDAPKKAGSYYMAAYEVSEGNVSLNDLIYIPSSDSISGDEFVTKYTFFTDRTLYQEYMCDYDVPKLPFAALKAQGYIQREWIKESFPALWPKIQIQCSSEDWSQVCSKHVRWTLRYQNGSCLYESKGIGSVRTLYLMCRRLWWYRRVMKRRTKVLQGDALAASFVLPVGQGLTATYDEVVICSKFLLDEVVRKVPVPMLVGEVEQLLYNARQEVNPGYKRIVEDMRCHVGKVDYRRQIFAALVYATPVQTNKLCAQALLYCGKVLTQGALDYVFNCLQRAIPKSLLGNIYQEFGE